MKKFFPYSCQFIFWLTLSLVSACGRKTKDPVVAKVGSDGILLGTVAGAFAGNEHLFKSEEEELSEKRKLLDLLIEERLLIQEAHRQKLDQDSALKNYEAFQSSFFLVDQLYYREVRDKVRLSRADLGRLYALLKKDRCLQWILFRKEDIARSVWERLEKGQNFDSLARKFSLDRATARQGGEFGCYGWAKRLPRHFEAIIKMQPGERLGPVAFPEGWVILQCYELRPAEGLPELEVIASELRNLIQGEREPKRLLEFIEEVKRELNFHMVDSTAKIANRKQDELSKIVTPGQPLRYSVRIRTEELTPAERDMPLLTYQGGVFTLGQYLEAMQGWLPARRPVLDTAQITRDLLFQFVTQDAIVKLAKKRGLDKDPDYLLALRQAVEGRLALEVKNKILSGVNVDSVKVKKYFDVHPDEFLLPQAFHLYEINRPAEEEILQLKSGVRSKADFVGIANLTTRTQLQASGGDLGWVEQFQFPELFAAATKMKIGQIAGPVKLADGSFSLIYLDGKRPARKQSFGEVQAALFQKLVAADQDSVFSAWLVQQKQKVKIEVFSDVLQKSLDHQRYVKLRELESQKTQGRS